MRETPRPLLDIQNLSVAFGTDRGPATVVHGLDLRVGAGETVALVGESRSGKSVTALAITRLIDHTGGRIASGRIGFTDRAGNPRDLAVESPEAMRRMRGPELAMIFQEPMTSLNPVLRIGDQIAEAVMLHQGASREAARSIGVSRLKLIAQHILPGTLPAVIVYFSLRIGTSILTAASLSFNALGAQPPSPEWGAILADGRSYLGVADHLTLFPGLAIFITVLAFNLLGDGFRDALDQKLRKLGHASLAFAAGRCRWVPATASPTYPG